MWRRFEPHWREELARARLAGILETFGGDDLDHMAVGSDIVMTCEFCNYDFRFPRAEVRGAGGALRRVGKGRQTHHTAPNGLFLPITRSVA